MTKAEEAAKQIYPDGIELLGKRDRYDNLVIQEEIMVGILRNACYRGYEKAEQDIISIIESRIAEILGDAQPAPVLRIELQELIDKIRNQ